MADHAFSNAGLGMFGSDVAIARQMSTPEGFQEKAAKAAAAGANPLAMLGNKAFETLANAFPDASKAISGIQGAVIPQQPAQSPTGGTSFAMPAIPGFSSAPAVPQAGQATTQTPNQYEIGGYRKFLRPEGLGTVTR